MKMKSTKSDRKSLSITDDCDGFEPISLDSPTSYCAEIPIETSNASSISTVESISQNNANQPYSHNRSRAFREDKRLQERRQQRQRFWMIVKVLMRYLKKKDSDLYQTARNTLGKCAQRHVMSHQGYSDVIESVNRELKMIIGLRYWERAEQHVDKHLVKKTNESKRIEEEKLRKKRFWMQVRVVMRYLKKKHPELYRTAKATLEDCEKRHVMKDERFANLVESVQQGLIQVVGKSRWNRAERHIAKYTRTCNKAKMPDDIPSFDSQDEPIPHPSQQREKRPREACSLKSAFSPPRKHNPR